MKVIFEPIPDYATPRKCETCQQPATRYMFKLDKNGVKNKSTRTPVCEKHSGAEG